jgi:DNA-directed RNA polymerase subunit H (RpoH/RPB5)
MELSSATQWRIKINCIVMMQNRGYDILDEELELLKEKQTGELDDEYLNVVYTADDKPNTLVSLAFNETLNKEAVIEIINLAEEQECKKIILVINSLKYIGASGLNELSTRSNQIQTTLFTAEEMIVNPTAHIYSPKYRKLTEREKENLAKEINFKQLPLLRFSDIRELKLETKQQRSKLIHDQVVKYLDFQPGDVIEEKGVNFPLNLMVREYIIYRYVK